MNYPKGPRVIDLTRDDQAQPARTPQDRVARLKKRLEQVDAHGDLRSVAKMRDVLKGILDLLADELR